MQITIALDGSRRRDLKFFDGDSDTLSVVVYAKDGDDQPLTVTDVSLNHGGGSTLLPAVSFIDDFPWRSQYTLTGAVNGKRTTLAYGLLYSVNNHEFFDGFLDYGVFVWGQQPPIMPGGYLQ